MQCSFCYGHGHNRMGCPKAKKLATAALPQWRAWRKMKHARSYYVDSVWRAGSHFDWDFQTKEAMEIWLKKQKRSKVTKTCNFCGGHGHNKRTCQDLHETKKKLLFAETGFRGSVVAGLKRTGQGIGAIISGEREFWCKNRTSWVVGNSVGLVVGHDWGRLELVHTRRHGDLYINNIVSEDFLKVRWNTGQTDRISSVGEVALNGRPLFYRGWQVSKLSIVAKSDKLMIPEGYLLPVMPDDLLKGRKAQSKHHFDNVLEQQVKDLIVIGQKMSSTS